MALHRPEPPDQLTPSQRLMRQLHREGGGRIVLVVADGLGGLPMRPGGRTELEQARTPNMDRLVRDNVCGLLNPMLPGITCGSGPGHLALFGYDPMAHDVGRGVLTALGIGFDLTDRDIAFRGNFATVDDEGVVVDRRAGRLQSDRAAELVDLLRSIDLEDVEVFVEPVKAHRFCLVLRGDGLHVEVTDTDPHVTGTKPRTSRPGTLAARPTAKLVNQFMAAAADRLAEAGDEQANAVLLRGAGRHPHLLGVRDIYGLKAAASALVPMYRGVSSLLDMDVLDPDDSLHSQFDVVLNVWDDYDLFFVHHKTPDKKGEDGDFDARVSTLEALDQALPRLLDREPDVLIVTGDHSTPARLEGHSWHPVPVLLAAETCRPDSVESFGEAACLGGGLGQFNAQHLMALAMGHALRLDKFGA